MDNSVMVKIKGSKKRKLSKKCKFTGDRREMYKFGGNMGKFIPYI